VTDLMIDIETLGTGPDSVVCSVGAVAMDMDKLQVLGIHGHWALDWNSQIRAGRKIDPDTVAWWMQQHDLARQALVSPNARQAHTPVILREISEFFARVKPAGVWANGADFDCVLIQSLYRSFEQPAPFNFRQHRCYRTVRALCPYVQSRPMGNKVAHNALHDALYQADQLMDYLASLRGQTRAAA